MNYVIKYEAYILNQKTIIYKNSTKTEGLLYTGLLKQIYLKN